MDRQNTPDLLKLSPREWLLLAVVSVGALVLSSLDQSTRGPSLTGLLLANLHLAF